MNESLIVKCFGVWKIVGYVESCRLCGKLSGGDLLIGLKVVGWGKFVGRLECQNATK